MPSADMARPGRRFAEASYLHLPGHRFTACLASLVPRNRASTGVARVDPFSDFADWVAELARRRPTSCAPGASGTGAPGTATRGRATRVPPCEGAGAAVSAAVDLTAVAAFTAAGLSLVNVAMTGRMTRRTELDRWRRDAERPVVVEVVAASRAARIHWAVDAEENLFGLGPRSPERREEDEARIEAVSQAVDDLYLVAGDEVRSAAYRLLAAHRQIEQSLLRVDLAHRTQENVEQVVAECTFTPEQIRRFLVLEDGLRDAARRDIGIVDGSARRRVRRLLRGGRSVSGRQRPPRAQHVMRRIN